MELKKRPGNKKIEKRLKLLKQQINSLENQEMVWTLKKMQQKVFEGANKPRKLLANQLKKKRESRLINGINGRSIYMDRINKYIQKLGIKKLTKEQNELLEEPILEVIKVIQLIKKGKALGPDNLNS